MKLVGAFAITLCAYLSMPQAIAAGPQRAPRRTSGAVTTSSVGPAPRVAVSRTRKATTWALTFNSQPLLYRASRSGAVWYVFLQSAGCPTSPTLGCVVTNGEARLSLYVPLNEQVTVRHAFPKTLLVSVSVIPTSRRRRARAYRRVATLTSSYFRADAMERTWETVDHAARNQLLILIAANPRSTLASEARQRLSIMPPPTRPRFVSQTARLVKRALRRAQAVEVTVIDRGGDPVDPQALTRLYYFMYDPRTGSLLQYGDRPATDALAHHYGLPTNTRMAPNRIR